jgi:hypothetical protein
VWIVTREKPTGSRLFRVCATASVLGVLFGELFLLTAWAATDFDPGVGRDFRYIGVLLVVILSVATVLHYPWSPTWVRAGGARPDDDPQALSRDAMHVGMVQNNDPRLLAE